MTCPSKTGPVIMLEINYNKDRVWFLTGTGTRAWRRYGSNR
jgi:hypothetical protein